MAAALVLKSAFHGLARLDVEETGRHAVLVAAISIGESPLTATPERSLPPEEQQDGASVHFVAIGLPGITAARGLWSCAVTDYALGRLIDRAPGVSVDDVIAELHLRVLAIPEANLPKLVAEPKLIIPGGPGAFTAGVQVCKSSVGNLLVIVRARSWVPSDMVDDDLIG